MKKLSQEAVNHVKQMLIESNESIIRGFDGVCVCIRCCRLIDSDRITSFKKIKRLKGRIVPVYPKCSSPADLIALSIDAMNGKNINDILKNIVEYSFELNCEDDSDDDDDDESEDNKEFHCPKCNDIKVDITGEDDDDDGPSTNYHCHQCGNDWTVSDLIVCCPKCGYDKVDSCDDDRDDDGESITHVCRSTTCSHEWTVMIKMPSKKPAPKPMPISNRHLLKPKRTPYDKK